jgi:hypothetical protein
MVPLHWFCCRDAPRLRSVTAGLLQAADAPRVQPGKRRSAVLLLGRLLVGVMLLVAGYMQVRRRRSMILPGYMSSGYCNGTPV